MHLIFSIFSLILLTSLASCDGEKNNFLVTEKNIDSLVKAEPNNVDYLVQKSEYLLKVSDFRNALPFSAKAFRLDKKNMNAAMVYALALSNYAERSDNDVEASRKLFEKVVLKDGKNLRAKIGLAACYSMQANYEKSFKAINEVLKQDPKYRDAYILKGTNYLTLGNRAFAYSSYETAIQQDKDFFEGYLYLGYLYSEDSVLSKRKFATEYFRTAISLKPTSTDAQYGVAMSLQEQGLYEEALAEYRQLLRINPKFYFGYFNQGYIKHIYQKDLDSANYFYRETINVEPESVKAWHNLGLVFEAQGRLNDALKAYAKVTTLNKDYQPTIKRINELRKNKLIN